MADLQTLANLAEILGAATVVGGVLFAVVQIRQFQRQRRDAAALTFVSGWDAASMESLDHVYALPDGAPPEALVDSSMQTAAHDIYVRFEVLGLMVHTRYIPLEAANDWAGGAVRVAWRKLRPWIEAKREATGSARPGEWFQWLAERFEDMPQRDEKIGAYEAYRRWR